MDRRQFIGGTVATIAMPAMAASWAGRAVSAPAAVSEVTGASASESVWRIEGWSARSGADASQDGEVWIALNSSGQCAWR